MVDGKIHFCRGLYTNGAKRYLSNSDFLKLSKHACWLNGKTCIEENIFKLNKYNCCYGFLR